MIAEISAGWSSLKAAKDIVQALNGMQTAAAINDVRITLQGHLLEAQQSLLSAQETHAGAAQRIAQLEQEIMRLKDWETEKAAYQLKDAGRGAMVYASTVDLGEEPHWLCANCFNQNQKSYLQFKGQDTSKSGGLGNEATYACDRCKGSIKTSYRMNPKKLADGAPELTA